MVETISLPVADAVARLQLFRSENVGPVTFRQLVQRFGSAAAAVEALPDLARRGGRRTFRTASRSEVEEEIALVESVGATLLFAGVPPYPPLLADTEDAPPVLTAKGRLELLERPAVAMVGARNASAMAVRFARQLAAELAQDGLVIVSGLARGIDAASHAAALDHGTVAIVAGGADIVFPPENEQLHERIAEEGLVLAEQPLGTEPQARHFPRRNRIIAGLSLGTLVVEAAVRSGSLITARFAAEYGREVMAVPGSPLDPRAQGCNQLIREGATLIQSADDVIELLQPFRPRHKNGRVAAPPSPAYEVSAVPEPGEEDRRRIAGLLGPLPVHTDELVRQSGCPPALVQSVLVELELAGRIDRHAGSRVSLIF